MKFLLTLLIIYVISNSSNCLTSPNSTLSDTFFKLFTENKYILPKEEEINRVDTRLLIRMSVPGEYLNGIFSF